MRVAIADYPFSSYFVPHFPEARVIKSPEDRLDEYDLLILTGGQDVTPTLYNRDYAGAYGCSPERDAKEISLLNTALRNGKKVLGVCRGLQLINVTLGGDLFQDLGFDGLQKHRPVHAIEHQCDHMFSYLKVVNSLHHQGLRNLGSRIRGVDRLPAHILAIHGGLAEIVLWGDSVLGTQFHPEFFEEESARRFFDLIKAWVSGKTPVVTASKPRRSLANELIERLQREGRSDPRPEAPSTEEFLRNQRRDQPFEILYNEFPLNRLLEEDDEEDDEEEEEPMDDEEEEEQDND